MPEKGNSFWIFAFGYLIFAVGIMDIGFDLHNRIEWSVPLEMGSVMGETALMLMGCLAQVIGQSIRKLEKRLAEIDAKRR